MSEKTTQQFTMVPIAFVRSPHEETGSIPKGLHAKHSTEGVIEVREDLEEALTDIEGFSHLYIIWAFHRSEGFELMASPRATIGRMGCLRPARRDGRIRSGCRWWN